MYKKRKYPSLPPLCAHDKLITFAISVKINNIQRERKKTTLWQWENTAHRTTACSILSKAVGYLWMNDRRTGLFVPVWQNIGLTCILKIITTIIIQRAHLNIGRSIFRFDVCLPQPLMPRPFTFSALGSTSVIQRESAPPKKRNRFLVLCPYKMLIHTHPNRQQPTAI